jgi:hypothetical protein
VSLGNISLLRVLCVTLCHSVAFVRPFNLQHASEGIVRLLALDSSEYEATVSEDCTITRYLS